MVTRIEEFRSIRVRADTPVYTVALSPDALYAAVGSDDGLALFNQNGDRLLRYPATGTTPVHLLRWPGPGVSNILAGGREGRLYHLALQQNDAGFSLKETDLFWAANDLNSLALAEEVVVIGHLSPALTVLDRQGELLWQRHPDHSSLDGRYWKVALSDTGARLYAASAGAGITQLLAFNVSTGEEVIHRSTEDHITQLAVLPNGNVILAATGLYGTSRLTVYTPDFSDIVWRHELPDKVLALAADPHEPVVAVAAGYSGTLHLFDAATGRELAPPHTLRAQVNGLDIVAGRYIAAATEAGDLRLFRCLSIL